MDYQSPYATVEYRENDRVVLLTWKQFCCFQNYRDATLAALTLLQNNLCSNLIIDARNGFEDDPADVEWGFSYLLPAMAKTGCKAVVMLLSVQTDIEDEMDMWGKEFGKYFSVFRVTSYAQALAALA